MPDGSIASCFVSFLGIPRVKRERVSWYGMPHLFIEVPLSVKKQFLLIKFACLGYIPDLTFLCISLRSYLILLILQ